MATKIKLNTIKELDRNYEMLVNFNEANKAVLNKLREQILEKDDLVKLRDFMEPGSQEIFNNFQEERILARKIRSTKQFVVYPEIPERETSSRSFNFHPEIKEKDREKYIPMLEAYSGQKNLLEKIEALVESGKTEDEAARELFSTLEFDRNRKIVSLDIECASSGATSEIIEMGYIVLYPDGTEKRVDFLAGADQYTLNTEGTTFYNIHGILPEDIAHLPRVLENSEFQRELLEDIEGSVFIAHNARYELGNLERSILGFDPRKFQVLDTMYLCKFFIPESERNTNEAFVHSQGFEYNNPHVAHQDAQMTLNALLKFSNNELVEFKECRTNVNYLTN